MSACPSTFTTRHGALPQLTNSQPWVSFCSSDSTHILAVQFLNDVHTLRRRYLTVLKSESRCVIRNTFHRHLQLVFPEQRTHDAK